MSNPALVWTAIAVVCIAGVVLALAKYGPDPATDDSLDADTFVMELRALAAEQPQWTFRDDFPSALEGELLNPGEGPPALHEGEGYTPCLAGEVYPFPDPPQPLDAILFAALPDDFWLGDVPTPLFDGAVHETPVSPAAWDFLDGPPLQRELVPA